MRRYVLSTGTAFSVLLFAVRLAHAQFLQTPVPGLPGTFGGSVAWGDYDNDGRLDFLICGSGQLSLWHNTATGFSNVTSIAFKGLPTILDGALAWGDFDNDGRLDFLVSGLTNASTGRAITQLWRNTGTGFTNLPVPGLAGVAESSVVWSDFDNDGRLDFLLMGTTSGTSGGALCQLWRNTGNGFTNVPIPGLAGFYFGSLACADFDNDGWMDFLVTGITNSSSNDGIATQLWHNTGSGFTNVPIPGLRGLFVSSAAWGDYDNDGFPDFLIEGLSGNTFVSELWRNTGSGFTNVPAPGLPNVADGSLAWADYDNDGRPDLLITGLTNGVSKVSQVWKNTGNGFIVIPIPDLPGSFDSWVAWGDYDRDGRLDFLLEGTTDGDFVSQLWHNVSLDSNSPPAAPGGLSAVASSTSVVLKWDAPSDDHTPAAGLSYNVRIGTRPGASDVARAPARDDGTLILPQMGSARTTAIFCKLQPGKTYYWSVQAVDSAFAGSPFAVEQEFATGLRLINPIRRSDGAFEFGFTGTSGARFQTLATTNLLLHSSAWTVLGTPLETSPGQFQFTDPQALNGPPRFYSIRPLP